MTRPNVCDVNKNNTRKLVVDPITIVSGNEDIYKSTAYSFFGLTIDLP